MKGGILTLLLVLALGWTSCSNEEAIPGTEEGRDVTLSVDFLSAVSKETKADTDKTIRNRFIAAFRGNECTGIAFDKNDTHLTVKAKTGDVKFIAIANANEVPGLKAIIDRATLPTEAELKALTTQFSVTPQTAMIKVTEETKKGIKLENSGSKLNFRLFQLQAKVTFKVYVADQKGDFTVTNYQIDGVNQKSDLVLSDTLQVKNNSFDPISLNNGANNIFYTYERNTASENLTMTVTGELKIGDKAGQPKTYKMTINPTLANGGTLGIVHGWAYDVEGKITVANPSELTVTIKVRPWDGCEVDVDYGEGDK